MGIRGRAVSDYCRLYLVGKGLVGMRDDRESVFSSHISSGNRILCSF